MSDVLNVEGAYRTGRRAFMGLDLLVSQGTLVPRQETELLGTTALRLLQELGLPEGPLVIDMCCGSGNLACALAHHLTRARIYAVDVTPSCVDLARRNAERLGLAGRVSVRCGDLFAALADLSPQGGAAGVVDAIVCNPPYISTGRLDGERADLLSHEPREAFDGGPFGIAIQQRVIREALPFLRPGGWLLFEIGLGQERQVTALFDRSRSYHDIKSIADADGAPRVLLAQKR